MESAKASADFFKEEFHDRGNFPNYEDYLEVAYRQLVNPGDKIVDIGAHSGRHLKQLLELIGDEGEAWAFEPIPYMAAYLRDQYGSCNNVTITEAAVSDRAGVLSFVHVKDAPEESGLRERIYNSENPDRETIQVEVIVGDAFFSGKDVSIDYIKIDTEGGEIGVLTGLKKSILEWRPIISVEYGFPSYSGYGNKPETLYEVASSLDMKLSDLFGNIVPDLETWKQIVDKSYWDYFMVPVEKCDDWKNRFRNGVYPHQH